MDETLNEPLESRGEPPELADLVGQVLDGRYRLEARLGAGGMGVVYAARHVVLGTRLAIKVLKPPPAAQASEAEERFRREARAASAIGHPHIVDVRDFGTLPGGNAYYVMEHLEGIDLLSEIEKNGPLSVQRLAHVGRQVAEALGAAHAQSIVHRDLKPENVFLTTKQGQRDHVKLIDFGIAKVSTTEAGMAATLPPGSIAHLGMIALASSPSKGRFTAAGIVLGTPAYMSPEQCAGRDVDSRSDLYALGVLLFEASTGRVPFEATTVFDMMRQHQQEPPPDPRTLVPELPGELADLILHCLEKDPAKRPMGMHEVAERLAMLCPATPPVEASGTFSAPPAPRVPSAPPPDAPSFSAPAPAPSPARTARSSGASPAGPRSRFWIAGVVAVLLATVIGAVVGATRTTPAPSPPVAATLPAPVAPVVSVPSSPAAATVPTVAAPSVEPARAPSGEPNVEPSVVEPVETVAPVVETHAPRRHHAPAATVVTAPAAAPTAETAPEGEPRRPRPVDAVRDPWAN